MRSFALAVICALVVACGGGGGSGGADAPQPLDLSGWWRMQLRTNETAPWADQALLQLEHAGDLLRFHGHDGAVTGTTVHWAIPDEADPFRQEWDVAVDGADRMEGVLQWFDSGSAGMAADLRLTRSTSPQGLLTLHGRLLLSAVDEEILTAHATVSTAGSGHTVRLVDSRPDGQRVLSIAMTSTTPGFEPVPGTVYTLGAAQGVTTVLEYTTGGTVRQSTDGSVLFTRVGDTAVEGSYTSDFGAVGSLHGVFSAPVVIRD